MIDYQYANDLNSLYNAAIKNLPEGDTNEMQRALDNLEAHIQSLDHWRDTALQLSKLHGEAEADANNLAAEYEAALKEIGGVYWEDPFESSPALIAHKIRLERK